MRYLFFLFFLFFFICFFWLGSTMPSKNKSDIWWHMIETETELTIENWSWYSLGFHCRKMHGHSLSRQGLWTMNIIVCEHFLIIMCLSFVNQMSIKLSNINRIVKCQSHVNQILKYQSSVNQWLSNVNQWLSNVNQMSINQKLANCYLQIHC